MVVVFPAPLAPINPAMVPAGTLMVSPSTAVRLPKCLRKPCVSMAKAPEALPEAEDVPGVAWDAGSRSGERDIGTPLRWPPIWEDGETMGSHGTIIPFRRRGALDQMHMSRDYSSKSQVPARNRSGQRPLLPP